MRNHVVYLDHASTTPTNKRVLEAMLPYFTEEFGNPSSFHSIGLHTKEAVQKARKSIAKWLNAHEDEIIFTSGGTESDALAVTGISAAAKNNIMNLYGKNAIPHVIASAIEHHAVLEPLLNLQKNKEIELDLAPVNKDGIIEIQKLRKLIKPTTILISVMMANNEIGTIQPIAEIGRLVLAWRKEHKTAYPYFHSDACQATTSLDLNVEQLHVDLLAANGAKMYGPKGIGFLFVRRGTPIEPMIRGGNQERKMRSGTENVPGIIGIAKALEIAQENREKGNIRVTRLRDRLIEGLLRIPKTRLNGHPTQRLPNNVNISFLDIEGEAAVLYLDAQNIMASTGSACASASLEPSHVIRAIGLPYEAAHGSIRFSLGHETTLEDIDRVIEVMPKIVEMLRQMSPVNLNEKYYVK